MQHPRLKSAKKIFWVGYLVLALIVAQALRLHLHVYAHDKTVANHVHQVQAHVDYDISTTAQPHELTEIDLSSDGVLKQLSLQTLGIAAVIAVLFLLPVRTASRLVPRVYQQKTHSPPPFNLRPPLRAPPR